MSGELRAALRRNFAVSVLDGGFFGFAMGAASFVTVVPLFVSKLTDSAMLIALIPSIHMLGWQLPQLLTVRRVARLRRYLPFVLLMTLHERAPFFGLALVALAIPYLDPALALALIFLILIWQGFGGGFTATAWQSMVAKIIPAGRRGAFFGIQAAAASLGGALSASLAGWILQDYPYPLNFALVFGLATLAMTVSWCFLASVREPAHIAGPHLEGSRAAFFRGLPAVLQADVNFAWYLVSRGLMQLAFVGTAFYSVFAVQHHGVSEVMIGLFTSILLGTKMILNPIVGWMGDIWGHRLVMACGTVALGLGAVLASMAPSGDWFALVFLLTGIGQVAFWVPGHAIVLDFAPEQKRQIYIGLANTLPAPMAIVAPLLGGWLAEGAGYHIAFLASALSASFTALVLLRVVRDPQRLEPLEFEEMPA